MNADQPRRRPIAPAAPETRHYTDAQVTDLLTELRHRGEKFGLHWGSARTNGTVDGHHLVNFGNAPLSTLLNLLALLKEATPWES